MSYTDCIARISQLDSLVRSLDPSWVGSLGMSSDTSGVVSGQDFSGLLTGMTETTSATQPSNSTASKWTLGGRMMSPVSGARETQAFGPTNEKLEPSATVNGVHYAHYHNGIDLAARLGTPVHAVAAGTVIAAGKESDGAIIVKIRHADGCTTLYGHLDPSLDVKVGDTVAEGQQIGKIGMTGVTTGPHLHFTLYSSTGKAIDPTPYLASGQLPGTASTGSSGSSSLPSWAYKPAVMSASAAYATTANLYTVMPATLMSPDPADPNKLVKADTAEVLAKFDASSSRIPYASQIRAAAISAGIDPSLLAGLVKAESSFHVNSHSKCGAEGLTQLMPRTAASLGVSNPWDAQQNLDGGAKYLAKQMRNFGRVDRALAAYNAGAGAVHRLGAVPNSKKGYVAKILRTWSSYQGTNS